MTILTFPVKPAKETQLVCSWCGDPVSWSRFHDTFWCGDCRCDEVREQEC